MTIDRVTVLWSGFPGAPGPRSLPESTSPAASYQHPSPARKGSGVADPGLSDPGSLPPAGWWGMPYPCARAVRSVGIRTCGKV